MQKIDDIFQKYKDNKDDITYEELYKSCYKIIYGISFSMVKNKENAEDIVQIVLTKILNMPINKIPDKYVSSWLYTVSKNETISYMRKQKANAIDIDSIYEIEDSNNDIEKYIDKENYNNIIRCLDEKEKSIVSLKVLSNLSFKEIGKLLNEPIGTIKWRYYKAMHSLKLALLNTINAFVTFVIGLHFLFKKGVYDTTSSSIPEIENSYNAVETSVNKVGIVLVIISFVFLIFSVYFYVNYRKAKVLKR